MRKIFYLCIGLALNSCVDQASDNVVFTIFNKTDKTVKVLGFDRQLDVNTNGKAEPIVIQPNSKFKVTRVTGIDDDLGNAFYSIQGVDSVRVIFNNERVKIFDGLIDIPCTICFGDENYQHFITEDDYKSAEACNGNCE